MPSKRKAEGYEAVSLTEVILQGLLEDILLSFSGFLGRYENDIW
jgi:hypothetical protein